MKPGPFTHHEPTSLDEALAILAEVAGDDGHVLAGGQTLIPAMALRLARPSHLVDINRIDELNRLDVHDGQLRIGACVRHAAFHRPVVDGPLGELLVTVVRQIAHLPIRTRGTFCGSVANADAASEWCLATRTLDGTVVLRSVRGERLVPAADFFQGVMTTAVEPGELIKEVRLPLLAPDTRFGFEEFSRRAGDFAQAMSLVTLRLDGGRLRDVRIGMGGVSSVPMRMDAAQTLLEGQAPDDALLLKAAQAVREAIDPIDYTEETILHRRDLAQAVALRALNRAVHGTPGGASPSASRARPA